MVETHSKKTGQRKHFYSHWANTRIISMKNREKHACKFQNKFNKIKNTKNSKLKTINNL